MYLAYVYNVNEDANALPPYGFSSWLSYWEKKQRRRALRCHVLGCPRPAEVGAQVYLVIELPDKKPFTYYTDRTEQYVIPLCERCSQPDNESMMKVLAGNLIKKEI